MEQDKISQTQLNVLLWAGLMAPAAELLPAVTLTAAGRGAWLSGLVVLPVWLILGWMMAKLGRKLGGLTEAILYGLGPVAGRLVLAAYLLWGELLLALRLRLCAQRLIAAGERDGSLWFFLPVSAFLVLWMARGKLSAFARAGQVFFAVLLTGMGVVLGLSLCHMRQENLFPLWLKDIVPILESSVPLAGIMGYGIFACFLLADTEADDRKRRNWFWWSTAGFLALTLEQASVIGNLGSQLAQQINSPFFAMAKNVGVEGAFQRVESMIAAIWTFADFCLMGVLAFSLWKIAEGLFPKAAQKPTVTTAILPGMILGIAAFPEGIAAEEFGGKTALQGNLIMGILLPVVVFLFCCLRRKLHLVANRKGSAEDVVRNEKVKKKPQKTEKSD